MFLPSNITLKFGDSGDFVAELQRRLSTVKAHDAEASGYYDAATVTSVTGFQSRSGLRADGIAGPETLRRLNGVISGDTSTTSSKKEEEAKPAPTAAVMQDLYGQTPQTPAPQPMAATEAVATTVAAEVAMTAFSNAAFGAQAPMPPVQAPSPEQPIQQQQQPQPQQAMREPPVAQPSPTQAAQPAAHQAAPVAMHTPVEPQAQAPAAEQPRGLVGRAMQKIDAFVQKMAEYFEAKLPPDVLREVQKLGQVMAQSGVREVPIPAGPEQARGPSIPAPTPGRDQPAQIPQRH